MRWTRNITVASMILTLASCDGTSRASTTKDAADTRKAELKADPALASAEAELVNQLRCEEPAQAAVVITAMLRSDLVKETDDGGDGIVLFVPTRPLHILGFEVVRLGGWQPAEDGGAMPPFSRGPGTSPPNFISVTVKASAAKVKRALAAEGVQEGYYVADSGGPTPYRFVPGPTIRTGDDDYAQNPLSNVATIRCSADEQDFRREEEVRRFR